MTWYAWLLVALHALGSISTVLRVGERLEPTTPKIAALTVLIGGLAIWAIVSLAGHCS